MDKGLWSKRQAWTTHPPNIMLRGIPRNQSGEEACQLLWVTSFLPMDWLLPDFCFYVKIGWGSDTMALVQVCVSRWHEETDAYRWPGGAPFKASSSSSLTYFFLIPAQISLWYSTALGQPLPSTQFHPDECGNQNGPELSTRKVTRGRCVIQTLQWFRCKQFHPNVWAFCRWFTNPYPYHCQ